MHLIINSLDMRGWMSDGVSSRVVEKDKFRGREGVCCRSGGRRRMEVSGGGREADE